MLLSNIMKKTNVTSIMVTYHNCDRRQGDIEAMWGTIGHAGSRPIPVFTDTLIRCPG